MDAGAWVRVSSGGQDEANQIPDIERHCAEQGHRITKWYTLNDKSASKGEQQAMLDQVVADMKLGIITTVVCWHSDRMERRGPEALFRLLRQVRDAGGRIRPRKSRCSVPPTSAARRWRHSAQSSRTSTRCTWPSRSRQGMTEAARTTPYSGGIRGGTW